MRVSLGRLHFVFGLKVLLLLCSFAFSEGALAACTPSGNGNAACDDEGEAQGWVKDQSHQQQKCGAAPYIAGVRSFSGDNNTRIANINCYTANQGFPNGYDTFIIATFQTDCSARNLTSNARLSFAGEFPSCRADCQVDFNASNVTSSVSNSSYGVVTLTTGLIQYTGNVCNTTTTPATTPDPPDAPSDPTQQCSQVGTLTQCLRTDGQMCATASNGTQLCWPVDSPINQTAPDNSVAVSNSNTPPTTPANAQIAETVTNTTTVNNAGNTTTTTTVVNSFTNGATCPAGQTGTPPTCVPEEGGGVVGGESCATPPTCTGDALSCYTATQLYHTRCALTKGVTGNGDCTTPYVCSGVDQVACQTLKELHKTRCAIDGQNGGQIPSARSLAGVSEDFDDSTDDPNSLFQNYQVGTENLDDTGFLSSRACPVADLGTFTIVGETFEIPSDLLCTALAIMAALILLVGHIQAAMIVGRIGT